MGLQGTADLTAQKKNLASLFLVVLVAQPLDPPPIALQGIAIPIAPMFFRYRGSCAIPAQICPIAAKGRGLQGISQLKLPSGGGSRAIRGYR